MKRGLALILACAAMPSAAAEQCVWPFRTGPADVGERMKADLGGSLNAACPAEARIAVSFRLPVAGTPQRVKVDAPDCKGAAPMLARWLKARHASEFMPYDAPQDVAFKIALRLPA